MDTGDASRSGGSATGGANLPRRLLSRAGNVLSQGSRLPSLRIPRDLTLGGSSKRTFTPTIPVRREKSTDQSGNAAGSGNPASSDKRGRGRSRGGNERGRGFRGGRGRGRGADNLIQLQSSVFANGPAERMSRANYRSSGDNVGTASKNNIPKPKVNFNFSTTGDLEDDKKRLQELYKDDFIDDGIEEEGIWYGDKPVVLPLRKVAIKAEEVKVKVNSSDVKEDVSTLDTKVKVKTEPSSNDEEEESLDAIEKFIASTSEIKVKDEVEKKPCLLPSCQDLLQKTRRSDQGEIFLIQLPEVLPGLPRARDDKKPKVKQEPGTGFDLGEASTSTATEVKKPPDSKTKSGKEKGTSLHEVSEGYIGKIQLMKSGKTKLLLGNAAFDIELGTQVGFLQDLVSLRINEDGQPSGGTLTTLGHVKHKIVCIPDMDAMSASFK